MSSRDDFALAMKLIDAINKGLASGVKHMTKDGVPLLTTRAVLTAMLAGPIVVEIEGTCTLVPGGDLGDA